MRFFVLNYCFFNSSLMVSHFNMVVFKQKKYQKTHIFILGIWFLTSIWLFLNKKNIRKHTWFFTSTWLFLNKKISENTHFYFGNMVSHFNMVVFKQKNIRTHTILFWEYG